MRQCSQWRIVFQAHSHLVLTPHLLNFRSNMARRYPVSNMLVHTGRLESADDPVAGNDAEDGASEVMAGYVGGRGNIVWPRVWRMQWQRKSGES